jgi:hypothetical protein
MAKSDSQECMTIMRFNLNDLLVQAGGLTGSASKRVEIAMIVSEKMMMPIPNKAELFNIEIVPTTMSKPKILNCVRLMSTFKMAVCENRRW